MKRETSIATKMLAVTIGMYLLIVTVVSVVHIGAEYEFQKRKICENLEASLIGFEEALAVSLWEFNYEALEAVTTGILNFPEIVAVEIYDTKDNLIAFGGSKEVAKDVGGKIYHLNFSGITSKQIALHAVAGRKFPFFERSANLYLSSGREEKEVGRVVFFSNSSAIFGNMRVRIGMLLINVVATLIVFSLAFLFAINRYLRKPLSILTHATSNISIDNIGEFTLDLGSSRRDEFHMLGETITNMSKGLNTAIRERSSAVNDLKQSEKNLAVTLDSIGDGVIATDKEGRITRTNKVAQKLTGWNLEEAKGRPLDEVFHVTEIVVDTDVTEIKEPRLMTPVETVLATGEMAGFSIQAVLTGKDREEYRISESAAPIKTENGEVLGVVLVFRDISEELALQSQLEQSQRMDALGQLAGGIAHDFNNMLGGIIGSAELLELKVEDDEEAQEFAHIIIESSERAAELIGQLLSFARKPQGPSSSIDIHRIIEDSMMLLSRTIDRRIHIKSSLDAESFYILGDAAQLQSVFMNLGINASHAILGSGEIFIETSVAVLDSDFCKQSQSSLKPGEYIEIKITDTGEGIPSENLNKVFEPFFTTKEIGQGTGLGLAAVYGTVEQHKGTISVYSETGRGTCFSILLPLTGIVTEEKPKHVIETIKGSGTVLVVDDEKVMRKTATAILQDLGYDVLLAEDGQQALEVFGEKYKTIDIVLLDMIMPNINGRECFNRMIEIDPTARILLASGFSRREDVEEMEKSGLCGFITKPYRSAGLSRIVRDALDQSK